MDVLDDGKALNLWCQHGGGDFLHAHGVARNLILQHVHHVVVEIEMLQPQALVGTGVKNGFGCVFVVVGDEQTTLAGAQAFGRLG